MGRPRPAAAKLAAVVCVDAHAGARCERVVETEAQPKRALDGRSRHAAVSRWLRACSFNRIQCFCLLFSFSFSFFLLFFFVVQRRAACRRHVARTDTYNIHSTYSASRCCYPPRARVQHGDSARSVPDSSTLPCTVGQLHPSGSRARERAILPAHQKNLIASCTTHSSSRTPPCHPLVPHPSLLWDLGGEEEGGEEGKGQHCDTCFSSASLSRVPSVRFRGLFSATSGPGTLQMARLTIQSLIREPKPWAGPFPRPLGARDSPSTIGLLISPSSKIRIQLDVVSSSSCVCTSYLRWLILTSLQRLRP